MTVVGVTGTRYGMTPAQRGAVRGVLLEVRATEVHHGDCVGADAEFHEVAGSLGLRRVAHPPSDPRLRAFCDAEEVRDPKPYLVRDQDIVNDGRDAIIAAPYEATEQARGGTWKTIKMAKKAGRPLAIVLRDGEVVRFRWPEEFL
jgi:hypothetical protein